MRKIYTPTAEPRVWQSNPTWDLVYEAAGVWNANRDICRGLCPDVVLHCQTGFPLITCGFGPCCQALAASIVILIPIKLHRHSKRSQIAEIAEPKTVSRSLAEAARWLVDVWGRLVIAATSWVLTAAEILTSCRRLQPLLTGASIDVTYVS